MQFIDILTSREYLSCDSYLYIKHFNKENSIVQFSSHPLTPPPLIKNELHWDFTSFPFDKDKKDQIKTLDPVVSRSTFLVLKLYSEWISIIHWCHHHDCAGWRS